MVRSLRSLAMLAATSMLAAACSGPFGSSGLGAIDPPQILEYFGVHNYSREDDVASLTPTLVWESFPQQDDAVQSAALAGHRVEAVTYELRLWRAIEDRPGPLVYERRGLAEPHHTVEMPLQPSQLYHWSVRARFRLDGGERVTQWSSRTWNIWYCPDISREFIIPVPCAYRLATPAATP